MTTIATVSSVEVKPVAGRVYDAFFDDGWTNWTRFLVKNGSVIKIKGRDLSDEDKADCLVLVNAINNPTE